MNTDFDIEIQENQNEVGSHIQLPMNFLAFGEIESDDVKVYIRQDVYKSLEKYALSDTANELGTILLGDYSDELGKTHVIISNYIEAKYTDASASTLTFTHETWEYIYQQHDKLYPITKIVGWQHTHPNYGIFLSNYDLFIQENFFNMPFQVAYVIDPIQNLRGFFQWKNGRIEKLKGFYVYDEIGTPIKIEQNKRSEISKSNSKKHLPSSFSIALLVLLFLCMAFWGYISFQLNKKIQIQQKQYETLEQEIATQEKNISLLQDVLPGSIVESSGEITIEDVIQLIEQQKTTIEEQGETISLLQEYMNLHMDDNDNDNDGTRVEFIQYVVQQGDTLEKICDDHNIDISTNIKMIASINGITDLNRIYIGQILLLPVQK